VTVLEQDHCITTTSMITSGKVFIDTGAYLALVDPHDDLHQIAVEYYVSLAPHVQRVTSWAVISECYTWLVYHLDGKRARQWLAEVGEAEDRDLLQVVYPDPELNRRSRRIVQRFDDQDLSYTDALSLGILQTRPDIDHVFAFDHHLGLTGVPVFPGRRQGSR
jgi:predicted nucleic acid-binding protein